MSTHPGGSAMAPTERGAIFSIKASHSSKALGPPNRRRMSWKGPGPMVASNAPVEGQRGEERAGNHDQRSLEPTFD